MSDTPKNLNQARIIIAGLETRLAGLEGKPGKQTAQSVTLTAGTVPAAGHAWPPVEDTLVSLRQAMQGETDPVKLGRLAKTANALRQANRN